MGRCLITFWANSTNFLQKMANFSQNFCHWARILQNHNIDGVEPVQLLSPTDNKLPPYIFPGQNQSHDPICGSKAETIPLDHTPARAIYLDYVLHALI
jgi:hypothetical protein